MPLSCLKWVKYLIKIKEKYGFFPVIHELVRERRFPHFFRSQQPGKLPVIRGLVWERWFRPVFEAGNQANSLKQCIPTADYPRRQILHPAKDAISLWFVVVQMSWFMSWFTVVVHVMVQMSWFTVMVHVMVHCHGSWWFVVVRGGSW